jgi:pimeloyl-ACP methyl ester carboxylesterase
VRCAALCMRGERDFVTPACIEAWAGLPDVRFVTIADASHHALLEQPDDYLDALGSFVREHDT